MSFLLVVLNASALCVARTDICAPPNSTLAGQISDQGGQVTITPATPMKALGAEFRAGAPLVVNVTPWWSSDKTRGAIVHVRGELARESVISGATVSGAVYIGQIQGRPSQPQLVEATALKRGKLQVFAAGTVDVVAGMRISGAVDIGGGSIEITSQQPIRGFGLDFAVGTVRVEQRSDGATISGLLARAQEIGGVLVDRQVSATIASGRAQFRRATLGRATPLEDLGFPKGTAPAGTEVGMSSASSYLSGPGPFTVCGLAVTPAPTIAAPSVTFEKQPGGRVQLRGTLVGAAVEVQPGLHMTGVVAATYEATTCQLHGVEGMLARDSVQDGVRFAARSGFALGESGKDRVARGTLATTTVVDGLSLTGKAMIRVTSAGDVHMFEGTLAKPAPFEQWQVPAGTHVQRSDDDNWSFEVPRTTVANATASHHGQRVERVTQARSDARSTTFTLARPHRLTGTRISLVSIGIDHQTGCVVGQSASAQRSGMFSIPAGGSATVCGGMIAGAEGMYAVPSLRVGSWYATVAIAGGAGSQPPKDDALEPAAPPAGPLAGYWIQINSLCRTPSGIPTPPPPQRWIWVDLKGQATAEADRLVLARHAAKVGKPCPVYPCCVP